MSGIRSIDALIGLYTANQCFPFSVFTRSIYASSGINTPQTEKKSQAIYMFCTCSDFVQVATCTDFSYKFKLYKHLVQVDMYKLQHVQILDPYKFHILLVEQCILMNLYLTNMSNLMIIQLNH